MKQRILAKLIGTWHSCYLQLHKPLQNKWAFTWPRAPKNTFWNIILKWSQHELRVVLYNYYPVTSSPCILFSSIPFSLSLSPKQSISKTKHLFLFWTVPIWQQTNSQFRAPVHTLAQESKLSGHLVSLTQSFIHPWPSPTSNSPMSPSISIIFKILLLSNLLDH